jgi:hypothetical protein
MQPSPLFTYLPRGVGGGGFFDRKVPTRLPWEVEIVDPGEDEVGEGEEDGHQGAD